MSGALTIVGLGPGPAKWIAPEATAALEAASDIVGYQPYLDRIPERTGQVRHGSDNRVEIDRARHALEMAAMGRRVAVVSGGDPGIFAMAAAVFEAVESGDAAWRARSTSGFYRGFPRCRPPPPGWARLWGMISAPSPCPTI